MTRRLFLTPVCTLALAGCVSGPDFVPPVMPVSNAVQSGAFLRAGDASVSNPIARWWEGLGDPQLTMLVDEGLARAPGIASAQARVRQARAGLVAMRAELLPTAGASVVYAHAALPRDVHGETDDNIDIFSAGFDARWELDLWGGKRRAVERERAEVDTADARLADAQVALSAEIARTYVTLRARQASFALLGQRRILDARLVEIARQRAAGGTVPRQAFEAAQAQAEHTAAEQATAAVEVAALGDSLAVLTGQAPGALDSLVESAIPLPPDSVVVGDPAGMLARRPDVRVAERQLAAATAGIGIAQARRFPRVSLFGLIGLGGYNSGGSFDPARLSAIALPSLSWNFLDFGRNQAAVRGAEAGRDAALADYRAQVLVALQDAEAALARYGAARIALSRSVGVARHMAQIAKLQGMRAKAGVGLPVEAKEAERQMIGAQLAEATDRAALTLAYVTLAKSLGLGWKHI